jgi:Holliday junction resolvase
MASTPERKVKQACTALLTKYGAYWFYPVTAGFGRSGIPDIIACYHSNFLGIECKAGYNKPTALQENEMAKIRTAGGETMVVREDTIEMLESWLIRRKHGHD